MDQAADAGDDQQHDGGELIHLEREIQLQPADRKPAPEADYMGSVWRIPQQVDEHTGRHEERGDEDTYTDVGDRILRSRTPDRQRSIGQKAGQRQGDGEPDQ
jgi:hypothetical protein